MKSLINKSNIINSRRQAQNLKKLLSAPKLTSSNENKCVKDAETHDMERVNLEEGDKKILQSRYSKHRITLLFLSCLTPCTH